MAVVLPATQSNMFPIDDTLKYLYGLQSRGMKLGLRNMRSLLRFAGNPERRFESIHVAGTNGKGSTCAFISSILVEAKCKTGLYTSPHLLRFTERIRINGREIPERRLVEYARLLKPAIERFRATFFEATTCIAFQFFADEHVDIAVVETGLGGRLDSTNVIVPLISVITSIGMDHTEVLGSTLPAIAREKGGIIKKGVPCVVGPVNPSAFRVLKKIASRKCATFHCSQALVKDSIAGARQSLISPNFHVRTESLGFRGVHQIENARLAVATIEILKQTRRSRRYLRRIHEKQVRIGLRNVARNSGLHGRFDTIGRRPGYILDVAHNGHGMRALVEALIAAGYKNLVAVFGVMKDKDYELMAEELCKVARTVIAVAPATSRALVPVKLLRTLGMKKIPARLGGSVRHGINIAKKLRLPGTPILITGSHYVVGEAMGYLKQNEA